ncbi:MAG: putative transport system permease protein [Acidobacteriota bacterium]|jgi:putative ABC transport system permease protein
MAGLTPAAGAMRLFRWFIVRRIAHEPLRSGLTALGIALGVAVVVAIQLTNASSLAGFETALNTVSGRTSLEIVSAGPGVDELRLPALGWLRAYGEVSPVIEGDLVYRQAGRPPETLRLLGVDVLRDQPFRDYNLLEWGVAPKRDAARATSGTKPDLRTTEFLGLLLDPASAIVAARFAVPRGLGVGATLPVNVGDRTLQLTIRGLLKDEGPARVLDGRFVLMDIAAAQQALDRYGRVDRVEIRLAPGINIDTAETEIAGRLPPGLTVERPAQRGRQVERMLAAFHLNLTALSYIALLVGLFLVYNTVSVSVLSRRGEIGTLRGLGVTRGRVRTLFLAEAAALATIGSAAGLLIGRLLANATVALTSTTVSALYIATAAAPPALAWQHVVLAFATGVPLSLLAALVPALEASRVAPMAAMRGADQVEARARFPRHSLWTGAALLAAGGWLATLGPVDDLPLFGYASAIAIVFGASFLVPSILFAVAHTVEQPARRLLNVEDWLAVTNLAAAVPRLSISVAALAVSLSMMVAVSVMIGSFRETVIYWVGQTLQADLFVSPGARRGGGAEQTLSPDVVRTIAGSADVAAIDRFTSVEVPYGDTRVRVGGADFAVRLAHGTLLFKSPSDARDAMRRAIGEDAVVVSESFVIKQHIGVGEDVRLPTPDGPVPFRIAAVYYDYSSDRGVLVMDRSTFARHYGNRTVSGLSVYLRPGTDHDAARQRLLTEIGETHRVFINTNASLRTEVLRIFDSTFAITYALEIIAILVAILGISGTLLTLILERERDLTVLRLIGTDRKQIQRMVVGEAVLIGAISQAVGLGVGLLLSLVLIYVINVQSFGWTIQFHLPAGFLLQASILMVLATALAGLYPARRAQRLATYSAADEG